MRRHYQINLETTVKVYDLLQKLREHREKHIEIVEIAKSNFLKELKGKLSKELENLPTDATKDYSFSMNAPLDMRNAYDTVIEMLSWTTEREIKLSSHEFREYVLDEWDWKNDFDRYTMPYSGRDIVYIKD